MGSSFLLSVVDIAAGFVVLVGIFVGHRRRLSGELANALGIVAAFVLGWHFRDPFGLWIRDHTRLTEQGAQAAAFALTIAAALGCMVVVRLVLHRVMRVVIEEETDKIAGCFAGFVRSVVFVAILFVVMNLLPHEYLNRKFGEESMIGRLLIEWLPELRTEDHGADEDEDE